MDAAAAPPPPPPPPAGARYGDPNYWRAATPEALGPAQGVDWHADFDALKPLLARHLSFGDNLLVVGPGLSALHERLYDRWGGWEGLLIRLRRQRFTVGATDLHCR